VAAFLYAAPPSCFHGIFSKKQANPKEIDMTKLAIVSGGSKGLGAALCDLYLARGYEVVEFSRSGASSHSVKADFADPQAAEQAFLQAFEQLAARSYEDIVAINNAATLAPIGPTSWKNTGELVSNMNINVTSAVLFMTRLIGAFQHHACRKSIVNISSGAAFKPYAGWSLYCLSKAGIEAFVRSVAAEQEREPHPFRLVNIGPGVIDTDMQGSIRASDAGEFPSKERFVNLKNSGSLQTPQHVASVIARIVDDGFTNGARIDVADYKSP
jgi:NAD(P)-dependent dehydrogenase (short-subunit alcohol dehydrogenase family)